MNFDISEWKMGQCSVCKKKETPSTNFDFNKFQVTIPFEFVVCRNCSKKKGKKCRM